MLLHADQVRLSEQDIKDLTQITWVSPLNVRSLEDLCGYFEVCAREWARFPEAQNRLRAIEVAFETLVIDGSAAKVAAMCPEASGFYSPVDASQGVLPVSFKYPLGGGLNRKPKLLVSVRAANDDVYAKAGKTEGVVSKSSSRECEPVEEPASVDAQRRRLQAQQSTVSLRYQFSWHAAFGAQALACVVVLGSLGLLAGHIA